MLQKKEPFNGEPLITTTTDCWLLLLAGSPACWGVDVLFYNRSLARSLVQLEIVFDSAAFEGEA